MAKTKNVFKKSASASSKKNFDSKAHTKSKTPSISKKTAKGGKSSTRNSLFSQHVKPFFPKPKLIASSKAKGRTAEELFRNSDPADLKTATGVRLKYLEYVGSKDRTKEDRQFLKLLEPDTGVVKGATMTEENGHVHEVRIFFTPDKKGLLSRKARVWVDCTCGRNAFFYEYANARKGCGFIYRCNGDPATVTNPMNKTGLCKHGISALSYIYRHRKLVQE